MTPVLSMIDIPQNFTALHNKNYHQKGRQN